MHGHEKRQGQFGRNLFKRCSVDSKPLVSVIINCFNGEKYLKEAVTSVLNQTYKNLEIVFWDNQSKDSSCKIFKSFNDNRLKYHYSSEHTSLYKARNLAIEKCKGEFISFIDSDDWWVPEKLETQIEFFKDQIVGMVYSNYYSYENESKKKRLAFTKKLPTGFIESSLLSQYSVGIITLVIRKRVLKDMQEPFNSKYNIIGDFDLVTRLSMKNKIECSQKPLAYYRLHKNNLSSLKHKLQIEELEDWLKNQKTYDEIKFKNPLKKMKSKVTYMKAMNTILNENFKNGLQSVTAYPWSFQKIKLFLTLFLNKKIIKKIKRFN